jgi:GT2 family glycosyltransferase
MIKDPILQVQAVLYNDEKEPLEKAIYTMANAVRVEREKAGILKSVRFVYGDASEEPLFTEEEVKRISGEISPFMSFEYRVFGFNTGYGEGNNMLARDSGADYLLIINPDILVSPRTLIELLQPFFDEKTGIVEARQTPVEHQKEYDIETKETPWATGACIMLPAALFESMGGFDSESFFMYCEDVDLSWRIRIAGYKIIYQPLAPVYHAKRLSAKGAWQPSKTEKYHSVLSALMFDYKWSNDELLQKHIYIYSSSQESEHREALQEFLKRREEGRMPQRVTPDPAICTFVGNYYAPNRFIL